MFGLVYLCWIAVFNCHQLSRFTLKSRHLGFLRNFLRFLKCRSLGAGFNCLFCLLDVALATGGNTLLFLIKYLNLLLKFLVLTLKDTCVPFSSEIGKFSRAKIWVRKSFFGEQVLSVYSALGGIELTPFPELNLLSTPSNLFLVVSVFIYPHLLMPSFRCPTKLI